EMALRSLAPRSLRPGQEGRRFCIRVLRETMAPRRSLCRNVDFVHKADFPVGSAHEAHLGLEPGCAHASGRLQAYQSCSDATRCTSYTLPAVSDTTKRPPPGPVWISVETPKPVPNNRDSLSTRLPSSSLSATSSASTGSLQARRCRFGVSSKRNSAPPEGSGTAVPTNRSPLYLRPSDRFSRNPMAAGGTTFFHENCGSP